jgi:hypothetical protein
MGLTIQSNPERLLGKMMSRIIRLIQIIPGWTVLTRVGFDARADIKHIVL